MRKEILPEMFNYNKYPGPDFVYVADLLKSDACQFTVLENHKDALDATRFGQRFSEIMLKYDYIVGDWSNDQLRWKLILIILSMMMLKRLPQILSAKKRKSSKYF